MHEPKNNPPTPKAPLRVTSGTQLDQQLAALRRRIIRQASKAVDLLRQSLEVLWDSDDERVQAIRAIEREIDIEEVKIEQECFQILALQQPFAADFRLIAFCLKVNTDIERLADHASSIAKISKKIIKDHPAWPESLREMGERIPVMCQELLRAVINADADAAREVSSRDKIIDKLTEKSFTRVETLFGFDALWPDADATVLEEISADLKRAGKPVTAYTVFSTYQKAKKAGIIE